MRRALLLVASTGLVLVMFSGVALADTIQCPQPVVSWSPQCIGTSSDDDMFGTPGDDTIVGLAGNDRMAGYEGVDSFWPGPGNDLMIGGPGKSWFNYESRDWGQDRIMDAGVLSLRFDFVEDDGVVVQGNSGRAVKLSGPSEEVTWDPGSRIVNVYGSQNSDILWGLEEQSGGVDLRGMRGDDTLRGTRFNDHLNGGDDSDVLDGSYGNDDHLVGGEGDDRLSIDGGGRLWGEGGNDILYSNRRQEAGEVRLRGDNGSDTLWVANGSREGSINCGPDWDIVYYDGGLDPTPLNCEEHYPS